jgi:DNA-directed RNA polymerase subunit beta'
VDQEQGGEFVPSTKLWETTAGRALLSEILPKGLPFSNINKALKKKEISKLINVVVPQVRPEGDRGVRRQAAAKRLPPGDQGRHLHLHRRHAGAAAEARHHRRAEREVKEIEQQYTSGLVTSGRALQQGGGYLGQGRRRVAKVMMASWPRKRRHRPPRQGSGPGVVQLHLHDGRLRRPRFAAQIRQLAGMRGLMAKPDGSIIETPSRRTSVKA